MKKIAVAVLFFSIFMTEVFCSYSGVGFTYRMFQENQTSIAKELEKRLQANGCGPLGSPEWLVNLLNIVGDEEACKQHDIDYATLGMSKEEADERLYYNMYKRVYENHDRILSLLKNTPDSDAQKLFNFIQAVGSGGRVILAETISSAYKWAVKKFGDNAYRNAQAYARTYKQQTGNSYYRDKYTSDDYDE